VVALVEFLCRFSRDDAGSPATEYALIASLLAVGLIGGFTALAGGVTNLYNAIASAF
jgi:Flp pilus assembly pilin Flp